MQLYKNAQSGMLSSDIVTVRSGKSTATVAKRAAAGSRMAAVEPMMPSIKKGSSVTNNVTSPSTLRDPRKMMNKIFNRSKLAKLGAAGDGEGVAAASVAGKQVLGTGAEAAFDGDVKPLEVGGSFSLLLQYL